MCLSSWEQPSNNPLNKDSSILSGSLSSNYIGGLYNQMSLFYYFTVKTRPCVSHCWSTWVGVVLKSRGHSRIPLDMLLVSQAIPGYLLILLWVGVV